MTKIHQFHAKLKEGQRAEAFLKSFFEERGYSVELIEDREVQRRGIDAILLNPDQENLATVEFKTDTRTKDTGNIFLETVSVQNYGEPEPSKLGWIYTTEADFIIYYAVGVGILILNPHVIRHFLDQWKIIFRERIANNPSYFSAGICVPYAEIYAHAVHEYLMEED